ncbi:MAG TPA: Na+/H+ antiporter NhaA, partial [Acidimicrobiales bacterium]|nr:Na+/H+ antiporter NhaA [Acidimicrobiales bacterium]
IVDDLGAIVVIAVFYAGTIEWFWLAAAALGIAVILGLRRAGMQLIWGYVVVGAPVWYAMWQSGVHPTIAGVAIAFCTPLQVRRSDGVWSPVGSLLDRLHPWSSFVIVPLFALANAGVAFAATDAPGAGRVALGVVVGLVVGKGVGVAGVSWAAVRLGAATLPNGVAWSQVMGAALLAGVGFTMSLFITGLAFTGPEAIELGDAARQGILVGSLLAAVLGSLTFVIKHRTAEKSQG